jgi:hypothetical protein
MVHCVVVIVRGGACFVMFRVCVQFFCSLLVLVAQLKSFDVVGLSAGTLVPACTPCTLDLDLNPFLFCQPHKSTGCAWLSAHCQHCLPHSSWTGMW